ncbi:DUF3500 domain-containing protein [Rhodococcoides fascians]|uniref:DUF3500 domain-containing protein n=1 Tax=Rhodococcoides fascians TaxID=1828 RepID=UPI001E332686|nr:DUF3500 domain-containing protein [Rhodococcus fascians]
MDAYSYRDKAREEGTFTGNLIAGWRPLYLNEFRGITEDGRLRNDVHRYDPPLEGEQAPVAAMVAAANELLVSLDQESRTRFRYSVDAREWQTWANPEFMQFDTGIRLEFQPQEVRDNALALVAASLSSDGYRLVRDTMLINGFLGDILDLQGVLNQYSYNMALYGDPHETEPWGWQLYGHHLAVNCLVIGGRMVIGPVFFGAEPNEIDEGPHRGVESLSRRIDLGRQLMSELTPEQRVSATVYDQMVDPAMPEGRVHSGDERHLAGAFQDNRIIPFEGVSVSSLSARAQGLVLDIVEQFYALLPDGPRSGRLREVRRFLDETWLSWIGGHGPGDVFYYRIQSPSVVIELDHHCGVFLDYASPQPFHIHTVLRTPHGNDYGRAYLRQWQALQ